MRIILKTLAVATAAIITTGHASAEGTEIGGINYNLDAASGTARVTWAGKCYCAGDAYKGVINIPAKVAYEGKTYNVVGIEPYAFSQSKELKSVSIAQSVESIGKYAFAACYGLESVTFEGDASVKEIGGQAFLLCKSLGSIEIPESVEKIGKYAFEMCESLKSVNFAPKARLTLIDDYVFCHTGLTEFDIPESVTEINPVAFCSNPGITEITLPKQITRLSEQNPFAYNTQVTRMSVEKGNKTYDSRKDCNAIIETATNTLVAGCKASTIPASVTAIGRSAFNHCTDLTDAALPATIRSIGKYAYLGCTGLRSFYFPSTMNVMADSVFWKATELDSIVTMAQRPFAIDESDFETTTYETATLYVPAGTATLYRSASAWSKFRNIVELNKFVVDGVTYEVGDDGKARVAPASEGVEYEGTIIIPTEVVSGTRRFEVDGATDDAFVNQGKAVKVVWRKAGSGIETYNAYGQRGHIRIDGTDAEAKVYSTGGTLMTTTFKRVIPIEQGVYFVKIKDVTFKVIVD